MVQMVEKCLDKGKKAFTVSMNDRNPVQRGHNNCNSPGLQNLNPVMTSSVDENSTDMAVRDIERGVRSNELPTTGNNAENGANVHSDKYALELNTSLKDIKMQIARKFDGNLLCMKQNSSAFGFIPIYRLGSRISDSKQGSVCTDILQLHKLLRNDGWHNYRGLQIPVFSKLNYDVWGKYLIEYWDWQLPLLIKHGFPLDFDRNSRITSEDVNHKSAISYPEHVDTYLREEIENKAMLGPLKNPPLDNLHISPFMTCEKSNSVNRRVIIDLSWPIGESVNAGVTPD